MLGRIESFDFLWIWYVMFMFYKLCFSLNFVYVWWKQRCFSDIDLCLYV